MDILKPIILIIGEFPPLATVSNLLPEYKIIQTFSVEHGIGVIKRHDPFLVVTSDRDILKELNKIKIDEYKIHFFEEKSLDFLKNSGIVEKLKEVKFLDTVKNDSLKTLDICRNNIIMQRKLFNVMAMVNSKWEKTSTRKL